MEKSPEGICYDAVSNWLLEAIPELSGPLKFNLIAGGHSNLTYRCVDASGRSIVVRRPPLGSVLQSAHDMAREYRIVTALQNTPVPVARTMALCNDNAVNDAPFYVMEFITGQVLHNAQAARELPVSVRQELGNGVIDVLAGLHAVDPDTVGLGDLGRKEAYLARQLKRWNRQWAQTKTHEVPEMDALARLLEERMPKQVGASIVHGDFRLGNMIVDHDQQSTIIRAVLDWELCTLGDPLADVGFLLNQWPQPGEPEADLFPSGSGGFATRDSLGERYAHLTGRDLSQINYYRAFAWWRLAAIGQGVYRRYLDGAMGSERRIDLDAMKASARRRAQASLALLTES